jgi:hypothetical protein
LAELLDIVMREFEKQIRVTRTMPFGRKMG